VTVGGFHSFVVTVAEDSVVPPLVRVVRYDAAPETAFHVESTS
jgi:hypothetical protein